MVSSIDITIGGSKALSSTSSGASLSDMSDSDDDNSNNTVQSQSNDFEAKKVEEVYYCNVAIMNEYLLACHNS